MCYVVTPNNKRETERNRGRESKSQSDRVTDIYFIYSEIFFNEREREERKKRVTE